MQGSTIIKLLPLSEQDEYLGSILTYCVVVFCVRSREHCISTQEVAHVHAAQPVICAVPRRLHSQFLSLL